MNIYIRLQKTGLLVYISWKFSINISRVRNERQRATERVKSRITALECERDPS